MIEKILTEEEIKEIEEMLKEDRRKREEIISSKRGRLFEYYTYEDLVKDIKSGYTVKQFVDFALDTAMQNRIDSVVFRFKDGEEFLVKSSCPKEDYSVAYTYIIKRFSEDLRR